MATVKRFDSNQAPAKVTSEILDRQPPRSVEAERAVLGSMMLVSDVADDVALVLRGDDFYDEAHRRLYVHMCSMHDEGRKVDLTLLVDRLKNAGDLEFVGGMAYLAEVMQSVATAAHAVYYAEIVRDKSTLRSLIHNSTEILREAYDQSIDPREMLARAEQKIFSILDSHNTSELADIASILQDAMARIDAQMKKEHGVGGIETGFPDLDRLTGGMHPGELSVLAARPGVGKTALALNIVEFVAMRSRQPTLVVSLEMSSIELCNRMLCSMAKVNGLRLRTRGPSKDECGRLVETASELSQALLFVDDTPGRTTGQIAAAARRLKRKGGLSLVVIDYLQLIEADNPRDPRQEQVARMTRRLKGLARELKIPVLCLAQLNRQADVTKDTRPRLSHLRESGAIEQDADVVMFIHREDDANENPTVKPANQPELIIAKQRNGPTGDVKLVWQKDFTRFCSNAPYGHDEFEQYNNAPY